MNLSKKTKIVCTIGPVTEDQKRLEELLKAGMNIARLNFSHGELKQHQLKIDNLRKAVKETGIPAAILQDLSGPKIRIGDFYTDSINLKRGQSFTLTTEKIVGDEKKVSVNYSSLPKEVKKGGSILLNDGRQKLEVISISGKEVKCRVIIGGKIKGRRGVNLPGADLSISSITAKDKKDLKFGLKNKIDFLALSFVRRPADVGILRNLLQKAGSSAGIIAKIETAEAVTNIDKIIEAADGIMIARGDLAIEVPAENVPLLQKMIINKCNEAGKPVITATQMLESMIHSSVPTRAEVSDVANAILDGTDAIMLSEETTLGENPVEAVRVMSRIAERTEKEYLHKQLLVDNLGTNVAVGDSITTSAVRTADRIGSRLLISITKSGYGARMLTRYRPKQPILVFTPNMETYQKMMLSFGCFPVLVKQFKSFNDLFESIRRFCLKERIGKKRDKVVIATGTPFRLAKETNMLSVMSL